MLYRWLTSLEAAFSALNLFRYITFRAAMAGVTSIVLCLLFGPVLIRLTRRFQLGQRVREEVPERHRKKAGTPTMGGLLILTAAAVGVLLFGDLSNRNIQLGLAVLVWLGALGFWDDYVKVRCNRPRGLSKRTKLTGQLLLSLALAAALYFLPADPAIRTKTNFLLFKNVVIDYHWVFVPLVMFVVVGTSNAVNLSDGLDGLASGLVSVSFVSYAVLSYVSGHGKLASYLNILHVPGSAEMTVYCLALAGACLGFLWFNVHPAEVFMGDTGSLPLGGALALAAVASKHELLLPVVGAMFVAETFATLLQIGWFRATGGKRLFRMAPLHHHYEMCGWPESKVVARFMILAVLFGMLAIASLKVR